MVVKQAEDEITAAQMVSGAMYMGTRALTATSGVGFDLMSETVSLNAMIENPTVFVLAQRPGPATGLPTWTAQGVLLQAVNSSAGEFARCVLSVSNSQDAFDLMPVAFNLAEEYQISVIVLTDKQIAEALYTQPPYDLQKAEIHRGKLITDSKELKALNASDRYDPNAEVVFPYVGSPAATPRHTAPKPKNTIPWARWMRPGPASRRRWRSECGNFISQKQGCPSHV
jgi:2-oxoglutarate/2-oxoacid ferredoxin oxidoreductase subunit alpha